MEPELFEELKQCEDNSVNYIDFMESTELRSRIEELVHLGKKEQYYLILIKDYIIQLSHHMKKVK